MQSWKFGVLFFIYLLIFGCADLHCSVCDFFSCSEWGLLFIAVHGLLVAVVSLVGETGSRHTGSVVVGHGLRCSIADRIFPDQGLNPCPLHWQWFLIH